MVSIAVASGKGGVGKSSIALNLGLTLAQAGKRAIVVDADLPMANIGLMLGVERTPISLTNVLIGENTIGDAIYEGPKGMKYVPAELSVERLDRVDFSRLAPAIKTLEEKADFVLIDCAPGLAQDAREAMKAAKKGLIVMAPEPSALADALKVKNFFEKNEVDIMGVVLNMVLGDPSEIKKAEVEAIIGAPVIGILVEDIEVRRATSAQVPVVIKSPNAPFCKGLKSLAAAVTGEKIVIPETKVKKGLFRSIIDFLTGLFSKRQ